ncbi:MAG: ribonuclease III [Candidatus Latescibacterota bacterium]|jgi:ribonuclease-3
MRSIAAFFGRLRSKSAPEKPSGQLLGDLEVRIGYRFQEPDLLVKALKHRSYVYARQESGIESNERLEFLGDAVLDLLVAEYLFRDFRDKREGDLTQMKSLVVSRQVLANKALEIDLGSYILLSVEERNSGGGRQPSILCDAFEGLLGAMYMDGGLEPCRRFVEEHVLDDFYELIERDDYVNFKSKLLEHTQSLGNGHPRYLVHSEEGPDHDKIFSVEVNVTGERIGRGQGRSKKEAQQMAARDALQRLGGL